MVNKIAIIFLILAISSCIKKSITDTEGREIGIDTISNESHDEIYKTNFHQWLRDIEVGIKDTIISTQNFFIHFKDSNELVFRGRLQGKDFTWPEIATHDHLIEYLPRFYFAHNQRMYFLQGRGFHFRVLTVVSNNQGSIEIKSFENQHALNSNDNAYLFSDNNFPDKLFAIGDFYSDDLNDLIELKTIEIPEPYSFNEFVSADWGIGYITANFSDNIQWTFQTKDLESIQW